MANIPTCSVDWEESYRIIPTLFPTKGIFDDIVSKEDLEYAYYIESLTNDRLRNDMGNLSLIPKSEWVFGEGTTPIMAAFTHPGLSRFSTEVIGVYYASNDLETAIRETVFHKEKFYRNSNEAPANFFMRVYVSKINGDNFYDIKDKDRFNIYYTEDYSLTQKLSEKAKKQSKDGILYSSLRSIGNKNLNVAALRPKVVKSCKELKILIYCWDGNKISDVREISGKPLLTISNGS